MGGDVEALLLALCQDYCSTDTKKQMDAHKTLLAYVQDPQAAKPFLACLLKTQNPTVVTFIATALRQLVTRSWDAFDAPAKSELHGQLLSYIQRLGPSLVLANEHECLSCVIRVFARVVRLQWLEGPQHQRVYQEVAPMLKSSTTTQGWIVGVMVLLELTLDFSYTTSAKDRRQACSFRNLALPTIVVTAIETVQKFLDGTIGIQDNQESLTLVKNVLLLSFAALRFDFLGTFQGGGGALAEDDDDAGGCSGGGMVMLPVSISIVRDAQSMRLFTSMFNACQKLQHPLARVCGEISLQCIGQVAALRPSYFKKPVQREEHVQALMRFVQELLSPEHSHVLYVTPKTFHHFCVLLLRVATMIPLIDLKGAMQPPNAHPSLVSLWTSQDEAFVDWLNTICTFTLSCLENWTQRVNSRHYLMKFWAKLVAGSASGRIVIQSEAIRSMLTRVLRGYIESCLKIGELTALLENQEELGPWAEANKSLLLFDLNKGLLQSLQPDELEDPLGSESYRADVIDTVSRLASGVFSEAVEMVTTAWDMCAAVCERSVVPPILIQKRFAWLSHVAAAIFQALSISQTRQLFMRDLLSHHTAAAPNNEEEMETQPSVSDAVPYDVARPLASRVFGLMSFKYSFLKEGGVEPSVVESLELSYLSFMDAYRKAYFTDEKRRAQATLDSGESVLELITQKIVHSIAFLGAHRAVLVQSLQLLDELTLGVVMRTTSDKTSFVFCGKLLLQLPVIQSLLKTSAGDKDQTAPFYHQVASSLHPITLGRQRTKFYSIVTRLFLLSIIDEEEAPINHSGASSQSFRLFMEPFDRKLRETSIGAFTPEDAVGLCRDLRGVCEGCTLKAPYECFLYWMVNWPTTLERCRIHFVAYQLLNKYCDRAEVVVPILKLLNEIVTNKRDRISISTSGPTSQVALVLFKVVGLVLNTMTPAILPVQQQPPLLTLRSDDRYKGYYKIISVIIAVVNKTINSDSMKLTHLLSSAFQDQTLRQMLNVCLQMILAIPPADLQAYLGKMGPVYVLLDIVASTHIEYIIGLEENQLTAFLRRLEEGLCSYNTHVWMNCCAALASIARHFVARLALCNGLQTAAAAKAPIPSTEEEQEVWLAEGARIKAYLESPTGEGSDQLKRLLQLILQLLMTHETSSTWQLASALHGMILLLHNEYLGLEKLIIQQQLTPVRQQFVAEQLAKLMPETPLDLSHASRDTFARNVYRFCHNIKNLSTEACASPATAAAAGATPTTTT